jgi:hypothetical protein
MQGQQCVINGQSGTCQYTNSMTSQAPTCVPNSMTNDPCISAPPGSACMSEFATHLCVDSGVVIDVVVGAAVCVRRHVGSSARHVSGYGDVVRAGLRRQWRVESVHEQRSGVCARQWSSWRMSTVANQRCDGWIGVHQRDTKCRLVCLLLLLLLLFGAI